MTTLKRYDLHKNDPSKLHFEVNNAKKYLAKNLEHATVPHRHSFYQIIWFKEKGRHYVDFEVVEHGPQSVFFINKNQIHYFCPDSSNEGFLFHFNDEFINTHGPGQMERFSTTIFNEMGHRFLDIPAVEIQKMGLITSYIDSEILLKEQNYREQVYHHFLTILYLIERLKGKVDQVDLKSNTDYKMASDFKKLIIQWLDESKSVDDYAVALGTNTKTLTRVCKKYLLDTPALVIRQSKLLEAKRMLSNQKTSVKEIAYALGFEDPAYFTKYFKKGTGRTPKEFQHQLL